MNTVEVELYVLVDAQGDWHLGKDEEDARANYTGDIGALEDSNGFRMVKVRMAVPLPETSEIVVVCNAPAMGGPVQILDRS